MIRFAPGEFSQQDWIARTKVYPHGTLMQDWAYGEAKAAVDGWRIERGVLSNDGGELGVAQVLLRPLPFLGGGLAWINRGPLCTDGADYPAMLSALADYYAARGGFYLRIAPAHDAASVDETAIARAGFRPTPVAGWASSVLDLEAEPAALRDGLRQNWRNALNKAERSDCQIETVAGDTGFDAFLAEYAAFLKSRGIETTVTADLLAALYERIGADRLPCYRATHDGVPLGSVLVVRTADRVEYLAGTLLDAGRPFNVGQLLLWHAILEARKSGVRQFDLGGMDPDRTPKGIFEFKSGVNGRAYRLASEIEVGSGGLRSALVRWRVARARREDSA